MKIGIFGDSFAYHNPSNSNDSWVSLLSKDYDVTCYAKNGSSTYYSYQLLKENYKKFDKIIFVITKYDRFQTSAEAIPSASMAQYYLNSGNLSPFDEKVIKGIEDFLVYSMADPIVDHQIMLFHLLLLKEIQQMGLDILFIRGFDDDRYQELAGPSLWQVTKMENRFWGRRWEKFTELNGFYFDERQCHLCNLNNEILYKDLTEIIPTISGNTFYDFNIFQFVQPDDFTNYLCKELKGKL